MRITCPNCQATYEVGESDIPDEGIEVECSACLKRWMQMPENHTPASPEEPAEESSEPTLADVVSAESDAASNLRNRPAEISEPEPEPEAVVMDFPSSPTIEEDAAENVPPKPESHIPFPFDDEESAFPLGHGDTADLSSLRNAIKDGPAQAEKAAPSSRWRVPTPPKEAFLKQDPLEDILAEVSAKSLHKHETSDAPEEKAAPEISAPSMPEPVEDEVAVASQDDENARVDTPDQGEDVESPSEPDIIVDELPDEVADPVVSAPSMPTEMSAPSMPEAIVEEDEDAPEPAFEKPVAKPVDPEDMPFGQSASEPSGPSGPVSETRAPEISQPSWPEIDEPEPAIAEAKQSPFSDESAAEEASAEAEVESLAEEGEESADDNLTEVTATEADIATPAEEPKAAPAPHWSQVIPAAAAAVAKPAEVSGQADSGELVDDAIEAAQEVVNEATQEDVVDAAQEDEDDAAHKEMTDLIRNLGAGAAAAARKPALAANQTDDDAPTAATVSEEVVDEPETADDDVFHPWDGDVAAEFSDETGDDSSEDDDEDDFEWDEPPAAPVGFNLESAEPEEGSVGAAHMAALERQNAMDRHLQTPDISNVIQADIPQSPFSTMTSGPSRPSGPTPMKPTPVSSKQDVEAAIREQLSTMKKPPVRAVVEHEPEKKGLFRSKSTPTPEPETAAAPKAAPSNPLKDALLASDDAANASGSRKRSGFLFVMILFLLALGIYIAGDMISAQVPALEPFIDAFSGMVDNLRIATQKLLADYLPASN